MIKKNIVMIKKKHSKEGRKGTTWYAKHLPFNPLSCNTRASNWEKPAPFRRCVRAPLPVKHRVLRLCLKGHIESFPMVPLMVVEDG
jgi:hypothetical protein